MSLIFHLFRRIQTLEKIEKNIGIAETIKSLDAVKKGDIIRAGPHKAWVYALFRDNVLAAILSDQNVDYNGEVSICSDWELRVPTYSSQEGTSLTALAPVTEKGSPLKEFLGQKPPFMHIQNNTQLLTGYHQLDVCQPLSLGQTSLFIGKNNTGKSKLAYEIANSFAKNTKHRVVVSSANPSKAKNVANGITYNCNMQTSEISQYFTPYFALAHACFLRDQGFHVLLILDDLLFHTYKERSLFHFTKIFPSNIGSLVYEHSKHISEEKSLSSIILLEENSDDEIHRLLSLNIGIHMRSISTQVFNFVSNHEIIQKNQPVLDFLKISPTNFSYQYPIFERLRTDLIGIFKDLKEITEAEEIRKAYNVSSEPWDKYLLLDSKYFIRLLCQNSQLSPWEMVCYVEFVIYSIRNEMVSMFHVEMKELREEFIKYSKTISCEVMTEMIKNPEKVDPDWAVKEIDAKIIKNFLVEAKMKGWMRDFQDDYDELIAPTSVSGINTLKTEIIPKQKTVTEKLFEDFIKVNSGEKTP